MRRYGATSVARRGYLFGRPDAAQAEISGPPDAVDAVRHVRFGMGG
jgi:hypothetical protein